VETELVSEQDERRRTALAAGRRIQRPRGGGESCAAQRPRYRFQTAQDLARALRLVQTGTTYSRPALRAFENARTCWTR